MFVEEKPVELYSARMAYNVLGCICNNTDILRRHDVDLKENDFKDESHRITFMAINNMVFSDTSIKKITDIDIENYLTTYPKMYETWTKLDGRGFIESAIELTNEDVFKISYDMMKKRTLLQQLQSSGIDVSEYTLHLKDVISIEASNSKKKLENDSISEILNHYNRKLIGITKDWNASENQFDFKVGDGIDEMFDRLKEEPDHGFPFPNRYYNAIFYGMKSQKFMLRSADSGAGKTSLSLIDACHLSCSHVFDVKTETWENAGVCLPTLFISTEVEKDDLQMFMIAYLAGVSEKVVKQGRYEPHIEQRLIRAKDILKQAEIYFVYIDDFDTQDIKTIIESHIIDYGVSHVFMDYIQQTPKLNTEMFNLFKTTLREDQILVYFAQMLSTMAKNFDVFICSSTQLNRNAKETENRDATSLSGGKATANKANFGSIVCRANQKDRDKLKHILDRGMCQLQPNYSHWIYKARGGLRAGVVIWSHLDTTTMRETQLFCTDYDFNLLEIDPVKIEFKVEEEIVLDMNTNIDF